MVVEVAAAAHPSEAAKTEREAWDQWASVEWPRGRQLVYRRVVKGKSTYTNYRLVAPDMSKQCEADWVCSCRKGVSFLSRFMGHKKKFGTDDDDDNCTEDGELRAEGMDAAVFSQPIGFIPSFPAPPKYIRVSAGVASIRLRGR